eukprot:Phypoly_transcript_10809.p1 GENE.Phypoly_transcript_10809~~Phypoly_transcript_10809.p1  ORF type:complete len:176 (+),score=33.75 Phypoly_transcript_10809:646-1173(+)
MVEPVHRTIQSAVNAVSLVSLSEKHFSKFISLLQDTTLPTSAQNLPHTQYSKFALNSISKDHLAKIANTALTSLFTLIEPHLPTIHTINHLSTTLTHPNNNEKTSPNIIHHTVSQELKNFLDTQHHFTPPSHKNIPLIERSIIQQIGQLKSSHHPSQKPKPPQHKAQPNTPLTRT